MPARSTRCRPCSRRAWCRPVRTSLRPRPCSWPPTGRRRLTPRRSPRPSSRPPKDALPPHSRPAARRARRWASERRGWGLPSRSSLRRSARGSRRSRRRRTAAPVSCVAVGSPPPEQAARPSATAMRASGRAMRGTPARYAAGIQLRHEVLPGALRYEELFSKKQAEQDARSYRRKGLGVPAQWIVDVVRGHGLGVRPCSSPAAASAPSRSSCSRRAPLARRSWSSRRRTRRWLPSWRRGRRRRARGAVGDFAADGLTRRTSWSCTASSAVTRLRAAAHRSGLEGAADARLRIRRATFSPAPR